MNFSDLLATAMQNQDSEALPDSILRTRLLEVYRSVQNMEHFEPGDVIYHKFPVASDWKFEKAPAVFIKYVAPKNGYDYVQEAGEFHSESASKTYDMIVMVISPDGESIRRFIVPSSDFTKTAPV